MRKISGTDNNGADQGYLENWRVINSFIDTRSFREYFSRHLANEHTNTGYDYLVHRAQSLFKQPEINEPAPVYAAFNREEHKSDAARYVL